MQDFVRPQTLAEAVALRAGGSRILAGGTDIYPAATRRLTGPFIDIAALPDLRGLTWETGNLRIGAATTWSEIAEASLPPALDALIQSAREVGGRQIQNAGTIGGNLCNASPAADGVPPLLAVGASVDLASPRGIRRMDLADFITGPRQTALAKDEMMLAVVIPHDRLQGRSAFMKLGARAYLVISIAMVAVRVLARDGLVAAAALSVGSCSGAARRLPEIEADLIGVPLNKAASCIRDADVAAGLAPIDDIRATAEYRAVAAAELLRRAMGRVVA